MVLLIRARDQGTTVQMKGCGGFTLPIILTPGPNHNLPFSAATSSTAQSDHGIFSAATFFRLVEIRLNAQYQRQYLD